MGRFPAPLRQMQPIAGWRNRAQSHELLLYGATPPLERPRLRKDGYIPLVRPATARFAARKALVLYHPAFAVPGP